VSRNPADDLSIDARATFEHEFSREDRALTDQADDFGTFGAIRGSQPPLPHGPSPLY
jgi:hypothetical protein